MVRITDSEYVYSLYSRLRKCFMHLPGRKIVTKRFIDFYDWYVTLDRDAIMSRPGWCKVTIDELKKENW